MPLEKPAVVAVDPAESAKRDELTAGHARSSPHVRGTGRDAHGRVAALGITPPPRGEQSTQVETDRLYLESSPRVRGAAILVNVSSIFSGIIPARAGSSLSAAESSRRARDHPRVCGEQCAAVCAVPSGWGSSPRVRGAGIRAVINEDGYGIIPACARSSLSSPRSTPETRDHPRVCGEQLFEPCFGVLGVGSSPRVRGAA